MVDFGRLSPEPFPLPSDLNNRRPTSIVGVVPGFLRLKTPLFDSKRQQPMSNIGCWAILQHSRARARPFAFKPHPLTLSASNTGPSISKPQQPMLDIGCLGRSLPLHLNTGRCESPTQQSTLTIDVSVDCWVIFQCSPPRALPQPRACPSAFNGVIPGPSPSN